MAKVLRRSLVVVLLLVVVAALGGSLYLWLRLSRSAPRLDGELVVRGLGAAVTIERDALGVPRIVAESEGDAAFALGFLHAQDRFFQMDLQRRRAAGELAALVGELAVKLDSETRTHRFRHRAELALAAAGVDERALLESYTAGVNAGLEDLGAAPWEYLVLGAEPQAWGVADSFLVAAGMYLVLQGEDHLVELAREVATAALAPELLAFLHPPGTEWDAPMRGEPYGAPVIPGPELVDPRRQIPAIPKVHARAEAERVLPGSNNMAIGGSRTASGLPMVAGDMHLGLGVPTLWYRAEIHVAGARRVGPTLPGTPVPVSGSNGEIAWAFTNAYGDFSDLVVVEEVDGGYRVPGGVEAFEQVTERIEVKGGAPVEVEVRNTRWGPIVGEDRQGRALARRWVGYELVGNNLGLWRLWRAGSVEEALALAPEIGIPSQNLVVVDRHGGMGWTVLAGIPRRFGLDGTTPQSWANGELGWDGWIGTERPALRDPEDGRLWSANNRVVSGEELVVLGDSGYDLGARAGQIRDGLGVLDGAQPADLLAVQLDDRALFLERWQRLALELLDEGDSSRSEVQRLIEAWGGRAAVDSVGYRVVRAFRYQVEARIYPWLTSPCRELDEDYSWRRLGQREGPLWQLVSQRPEHFLPPDFSSWEELLLDALDTAVADLTASGSTLEKATWGERNRIRLRHPLSRSVPGVARFVDFPERALPGDWNMPRVQSQTFGASQRMVITPGREEEGIFQLPGGQSAHPRSPFYRAGMEAWEQGSPAALLAGAAVHRLVLRPGAT